MPKPVDDDGLRSDFEFPETVHPELDVEHGVAFGCKTINADALGWLVVRTTDKSVADALCERIWTRIETEREDFYFGPPGMARMACPEALENQARKLINILNRVERFDIDATGALSLSMADGEVVTVGRPWHPLLIG